MSWPTPQDYNEAIQNPHLNFADDELKSGVVELNRLGLPQPSTGAFASVYRIKCPEHDVAVRCFLQSVSDQPARYKHLADRLSVQPSSLFVPFEYIEHGVCVQNSWHPIVKMEWVQGQTLDAFVREHSKESQRIKEVLLRFETAMKQLAEVGIAHGDLQHGNIVVDHKGELRLIDYDGVFLPAIADLGSNELGHPNYQHPGRNKALFNLQMDNFSAWVIQQSLRAIAEDPELLKRLHGLEECLIFRHIDYANPVRSPAFHMLENSASEIVRESGRTIRALCAMPPAAIPAVDEYNALAAPAALAATADTSHLMTLVDPGDNLDDENGTDPFDRFDAHAANWPSLRDYITAVRLGTINFGDEDLQRGIPFKERNSIWRTLGRESVVIPVQVGTKRYAVKCFLAPDPTRAERYLQIESYFNKKLPWDLAHKSLLPFEYIPNGIRVNNNWYPIVKMPWLIGAQTLDDFVHTTPYNKYVAQALADEWRDVMKRMARAGISHGSLEPHNVLVHEGKIKLVDYDAMFVPGMEHKHYEPQIIRNADFTHPKATNEIAPHQDNFAAWLIDTAITTWVFDPAIYRILDNRKGQMLFNANDLSDPANSKLFALLYHNLHADLSSRAELIYRLLHTPPHRIPALKARATALLPAERAREHKIRAHERVGEKIAMASGVIAFGTIIFVPHSSLIALLPVVTLLMVLMSRREGAASRKQ